MKKSAKTIERRRILRMQEVERITTFCDVHLHRLEAAGLFPRRFKISAGSGEFGAVGWDSEEVQAWLDARLASRAEPRPRGRLGKPPRTTASPTN
jgi:predicted DNA-binding transcriptional regulator AlpA